MRLQLTVFIQEPQTGILLIFSAFCFKTKSFFLLFFRVFRSNFFVFWNMSFFCFFVEFVPWLPVFLRAFYFWNSFWNAWIVFFQLFFDMFLNL